MKKRSGRTFVAWACTFSVIILFAFPNYCDQCRYRDVARALAQKQADAYLPACCAGKANGNGSPGKKNSPGGASHASVPFCIGKTLSSITEHHDVIAEMRGGLAPAPFRSEERTFTRLCPVFDHKNSRGPPV